VKKTAAGARLSARGHDDDGKWLWNKIKKKENVLWSLAVAYNRQSQQQ
jgi:hypothetical protein